MQYETKDSGNRTTFDSGMQRDTQDGKVDYLLVRDGPLYERWARLMQRGAEKYDARNWMKARGEAELERFRQSAARHFEQWLAGDTDEDHAAAVVFNLNGAEYVKGLLDEPRVNESLVAAYESSVFDHLPAGYQKPGAATEAEPSTMTLDRNHMGPNVRKTLDMLVREGRLKEVERCCGVGGCGGCA